MAAALEYLKMELTFVCLCWVEEGLSSHEILKVGRFLQGRALALEYQLRYFLTFMKKKQTKEKLFDPLISETVEGFEVHELNPKWSS